VITELALDVLAVEEVQPRGDDQRALLHDVANPQQDVHTTLTGIAQQRPWRLKYVEGERQRRGTVSAEKRGAADRRVLFDNSRRSATMIAMTVTDTLGRPLRDLRISVTDRCNFRCVYCMPREVFGRDYQFLERAELLTFEEIARLARISVADHGVKKIRLTGGEPLVRRELRRSMHAIQVGAGAQRLTAVRAPGRRRRSHRAHARPLGPCGRPHRRHRSVGRAAVAASPSC